MKIQSYQVFRFLTLFCLALIVVISVAYYTKQIPDRVFAILSGLIAILASILGLFADKPFDHKDVSIAVDKVLLTYEQETIESLRSAKNEELKIKDYIEHRSNEIFLLKVRSYIIQDLSEKFEKSDIARLVEELERVEKKLDEINVEYSDAEMPARFKKLLYELSELEKIDLTIAMIEAIPFFPFKGFLKTYIRAYLLQQRHIRRSRSRGSKVK
jgi:hypothetical protein